MICSSDSDFPNSLPIQNFIFTTPPKSEIQNPSVQTTQFKSGYQKKFKKVIWSKQEDQLLEETIRGKKIGDWKDIATVIPNRSGKQCRERWHNHLREGVNKQPWNQEEFWILCLCVKAFGQKWSLIGKYLPGRSDNTIKNQWNCKMKPYKTNLQNEINRLLQQSQEWEERSSTEQKLLKIISQNTISLKCSLAWRKRNLNFHKIMRICENLLEDSLRDFQDIQYENMERKFELNDSDSPSEIHGGQEIFEESENSFLN